MEAPGDGSINNEQKAPETSGIQKVKNLAQLYRNQAFISTGVDEEATKVNTAVIESIKEAGVSLEGRQNDFFGILLTGSRANGYAKRDSDVDIVVVAPDTTPSPAVFVYEKIDETLANNGLLARTEATVGAEANFQIPTNPEEFVYQIDHHPEIVASLFGNTVYANPNLNLARLSALEVVAKYEGRYDWRSVQAAYNLNFLGNGKHITRKLSERYGLDQNEVRGVLTQELFNERYKKFGLKDPVSLLKDLRAWRKLYAANLKGYKMNEVYKGVMNELKE